MILLWCICYIIGTIFAVPSERATRDCLRAARRAFARHVIDFEDYIQHMPLCITTVGYGRRTCPENRYGAPLRGRNGHWTRLNAWYSCINAHNNGGTIARGGHSVVLWSGRIGQDRAELEAEQSRREVVRRYMVGNPAQWTDTQIPALALAFAARFDRRDRVPIEVDVMLGDLICLWFIFNADIRHYPINMYGSIDFWRGRVQNPGTPSLLRAGVRKALIVNAYFWKVEMLAILRLGEILNVNPRVNVILKQYHSNGAPVGGNRLTAGWDPPRNIFGSQTSSIPVIVRPLRPNPRFTMYNIERVQNLRQLIESYNRNVCNGRNPPFKPTWRRLSLPLNRRQLSNLVEFVDWTKKRFTTRTQSVGAAQVVTNPDIQPQPTEYVIELNNFQIFLCLVLSIIMLIGCICYITFKQCKKNKNKTKYKPVVKYDTETDNTDSYDI